MKKIIIILLLILAVSFAFAGKVKTLPELSNPDGIYTSENRLAITEGTTVYLYSLPDLKHIKTFGKKGEGPQEFNGILTWHVICNLLNYTNYHELTKSLL